MITCARCRGESPRKAASPCSVTTTGTSCSGWSTCETNHNDASRQASVNLAYWKVLAVGRRPAMPTQLRPAPWVLNHRSQRRKRRTVQNQQEYHLSMRRLTPALVAAFALVLCFPLAQAQIHGTPTSVTSIGFGGHYDRTPGVPASVTSLGPLGLHRRRSHPIVRQTAASSRCFQSIRILRSVRAGITGTIASSRRAEAYYPVPYPVYLEPEDVGEQPEPEQPVQYSAGPTIFDRRASDQSSVAAEAAFEAAICRTHARRAAGGSRTQQPAAAPAEPAPVADQPQTVLIFKDGHQARSSELRDSRQHALRHDAGPPQQDRSG